MSQIKTPEEIHIEVTYVKHMTATFNLLELIAKDNKTFNDFVKCCVRNLIVYIHYNDRSTGQHELKVYMDDYDGYDGVFSRAHSVSIDSYDEDGNSHWSLSGAEDIEKSRWE